MSLLDRPLAEQVVALSAGDADPAALLDETLARIEERNGGVNAVVETFPEHSREMLGTAGKDDSPYGQRITGNDAVYVVCTDPDALLARASAAGATLVRGLADEDYGSRGFTVRDPEGNLWSFGTYAGESA